MLLLATVLFLSLPKGDGANDVDDVCSTGLRKCLEIYITDVTQHTTGREICHDVSVFVSCILELECDLSRDIKVQSFNTVEAGLAHKGLKCDKIAEMKATYIDGTLEPDQHLVSNSKSNPRSKATISKSSPAYLFPILLCIHFSLQHGA